MDRAQALMDNIDTFIEVRVWGGKSSGRSSLPSPPAPATSSGPAWCCVPYPMCFQTGGSLFHACGCDDTTALLPRREAPVVSCCLWAVRGHGMVRADTCSVALAVGVSILLEWDGVSRASLWPAVAPSSLVQGESFQQTSLGGQGLTTVDSR